MNDETRAVLLDAERSRPSDGEPHDSFNSPPMPPVEPEAADCCGEGCVRCVFDVYDEAMQRYRNALTRWQAEQVDRGDRA